MKTKKLHSWDAYNAPGTPWCLSVGRYSVELYFDDQGDIAGATIGKDVKKGYKDLARGGKLPVGR